GIENAAVKIRDHDANQARLHQLAEAGVALSRGLVGLHASADIPEHALDTDNLTSGVANRRLEHLHVELFTLLLDVGLDVFEHLAGFHHVHIIAAIFLDLLGREKILVTFTDDFVERLADRIAESLITVDEAAGHVFAKDIERQTLDQRLIDGFRF